jgi:two-component system OmpR family sensor kinase
VPIRLRLALVVLAASAALVASGAVLFTHQLRSGLLDSTDQALEAEAAPITSYITGAQSVDAAYLSALMVAQREALAQVVSPAGDIVFSSPGLGRLLQGCPAKLKCTAGDEDDPGRLKRYVFQATTDAGGRPRVDRFLATSVRRSDGTWIVIVGSSLEDISDALERVRAGLLLGGGIAIALATVGAWVLGGAALRPVERMRKQVAAISERDPEGSIKVPTTRDELALLAGTMNNLLGRLREVLARERRFVADASHELRTPLSVLQMELELAANRERSPKELSDAVDRAAGEAQRLSRLADDLLFLARVDEGVPVLRAAEQDLEPVMAGALRAWKDRAAAQEVELRFGLESGVTAWFDPDRIRQALDNLIDNSLRFAPAGSMLEVSAHRAGGYAVVRVEDRGEGFPADFLPHAYERFSRSDASRSQHTGGSGLGLAVTAAIARAHGGWVNAANRNEGGAVVELAVPGRAPDHSAEDVPPNM